MIICVQKQVANLLSHIKRTDPRKGSFAQLLLNTKYHKTGKSDLNATMCVECRHKAKEGLLAFPEFRLPYNVVTVGDLRTWPLFFVQVFSSFPAMRRQAAV